MAAMASPTSPPSSPFLPANHLLLLHPAGANMLLRDTPLPGGGPHHNAVLLPERKNVTAVVRLPAAAAVADVPEKGDGPKTNAVVEIKLRGGAPPLRRPTPPGPRVGRGGGGGVIHAVVDSSPERPGPPAEGAGGKGGAVHAASAAAASS